ncbi:Photosystem I assembly protein Ycf3 [uncultured archaeon]|nr:Photosystem I assembly protein Ycf3 [uncultured archaeon]
MKVVYQAEFQGQSLTRTMPDGSQDTGSVNLNEIHQLEDICKNYEWNESQKISQQIGEKLFNILNGDTQTLVRAMKEADDHAETLQLILKDEGFASNLPFELLYHNSFLVPSRIHLIRKVSDRGKKRIPEPENRPFKLLLMACSPRNVNPVLKFEKEEDTILEVTKDLPIEIDVEDTGSLEGLGERLSTTRYDVVHLTGHADIDEKGVPFFLMESEEGLRDDVSPSRLWEKLSLNLPKMVFLSGCRTGEAPEHVAAMSFAHHLVAGQIPTVLGWGLPVSDIGASYAARIFYHDLSRGENTLRALLRIRRELFEKYTDWSILRLFSDSTPLDVALVRAGQVWQPRPGELQYKCLENSQVRVLTKGFIGRRRHIQKGLRSLRKDREKVGLLLHGTGGLGKSCLAGKLCQRFKDHTLIVVHGELKDSVFREALKDGFYRYRGTDDEGLKVLDLKEEMPDKIRRLCSSVFQQKPYLILLDDFEKNIEGIKEGNPAVCADAVPILEALLKFLPYSGKRTQLIITSRYTFPLTFGGKNLVGERLESIGLTGFSGADEKKKVSELANIAGYPDPDIRQQLIEAGHGNSRLMEYLDTLVGEVKTLDIPSLLSRVKGRQDEFVQELLLNEIFKAQTDDFKTFLRCCSVYRLPVLKDGIGLLFSGMKGWESHVETAVRLSLIEKDSTQKEYKYLVTPLLRGELFKELGEYEKKKYHQAAVSYYQNVLSRTYELIASAELIDHAISGGIPEAAVEEGGSRFLPYLRKSLAYREGLAWGEYIFSNIPELKRDSKSAKFMFELGWLHDDMGKAKQAIGYYEQALSIDKEVYGERHPNVATTLNNIGSAWDALGDSKKAIEYYEQALSIDKEVHGQRHPNVATRLNNIGSAWDALGNSKKAIEYYEQALSIVKEVYGEKHPYTASTLNNIGLAWNTLGDSRKAIEFFEQALSIDKEVYGERHPNVAIRLSNIGSAWYALGDPQRAKEYFQKAYTMFRGFYGDEHPHTRAVKEWLDHVK